MFLLSKIVRLVRCVLLSSLLIVSVFGPPVRAAAVDPIYAPNLHDISCPQADFCVAVGDYARVPIGTNVLRPLISVKNGNSWQQITNLVPNNPDFAQASLSSVSCVGSSFCIALGTYTYGSSPTHHSGWSAIFHGSTWEAMSDDLGPAEFIGKVSCASETLCMSSQSAWTSDYGHATVLVYQGNQWASHRWESQIDSLWSVGQPICFVGTQFCRMAASAASGSSRSDLRDQTPAVLSYGMGLWVLNTIGSPGQGPAENTSCPSIMNCLVSGPSFGMIQYVAFSQRELPLSELNIPAGTHINGNLIGCWAENQCVAIGMLTNDADFSVTPYVLQQTNSIWSSYQFPLPTGATDIRFDALTCVQNQAYCTILGTYQIKQRTLTYISIYNGQNWNTQVIFDDAPPAPEVTATVTKAQINTTAKITVSMSAGRALVAKTPVTMTVNDGPCKGAHAKTTANNSGVAVLSYICKRVGTDKLTISLSE